MREDQKACFDCPHFVDGEDCPLAFQCPYAEEPDEE